MYGTVSCEINESIFFSENDEVDPTIKVMIGTMYLPSFLQRILSRLLTLVSRVIVSD